jgi:Zn-dependent M28 family amino/carboxypeptidase
MKTGVRMASWLLVAVAFAGLLGYLVWYMVAVPGTLRPGPLAPLAPEEERLAGHLRGHVAAVASREHNLQRPDALEDAARYIEHALAGFGYAMAAQRYAVAGHEVRNIEVEVPGTTRAAEIIVVGAHYDSVPGAPGGNDNGSGVAAVLELSRLFRAARPARTLRFVLFVNEELPFYRSDAMGSRRYARRSKERGERIVAMFSLETIGYFSDRPGSQRYPFPLALFYPSTGDFIAFISNLGSRRLLHEAIASYRQHGALPSEGLAAPAFIPGVDWSDHASFWEAGYPALMVTDTAPYRYPHYHTASDTPDKVDYERLARLVSGLRAMLSALAG